MPVLFEHESHRRVRKPGANSILLQNNELYENILHLLGEINTGFLVVDDQSKKFLYVNEAFCRICKYDKSEIFQHSLFSLIPYNHLEQFKSNLNDSLGKDNPVQIFRTSLTTKFDQNINVEVSVQQLLKNNIRYILMIVRDVTEKVNKELLQKLTEEAVHESESRYRSLIERVEDYAIFMLDYSGKVISWNAGAQRIMEYHEDEIILKNFNIFFPETHDKKPAQEILLENAKKNGHAEIELELIKKSRKKFWALVSITTLNKNNFSIIIRDLTRNKISEALLHQQEIQLRSLAAHLQEAREAERLRISRELHDEFSQMLTVLRMDLTVLTRMITKAISDPVKRISVIEKISSISQLLESAIRSTRRIITELRPAVLDELGLFTAVQWLAQEFENRTGIRCKIDHLNYDINLDKNTSTVIFRILQEGLTNVAKHSGATKVNISLSIKGNELILEIKDNGRGITSDTLKAPTSTGLLGIRERVIALNGKFEIKSGEKTGTTLYVYVPYKKERGL